ncbi:lipopolysaccharide assembly protein LapB [Granulicella sp. S190]|uniref:tetratricopeptide repeat protein n=1 Tax=Granulicella sp. S190 TaxID=1747226 RepID=UPI00131AB2B1|nr:tetratricopeptide repeat protein [Granulicella sp. S190]
MNRFRKAHLFVALLNIGAALALSISLPRMRVQAAAAPITFSRQVAPILYKQCSGCHHPGGSGPFSLLSYADAKRWGKQIQTVTQSRYMPPWLPEPGFGNFADSRRLSSEDLELLKLWVEGGMPEGDPGEAPKAPIFSGEWQLGPPDLILKVTSPMQVPASGPDLFRNFILPVPIAETKYVRAMEIRPGAAQVVHHANMLIDRTASFRRQHPDDWKEGIPGMELAVDSGDSFDPDSHFLFWKPDSPALVEPNGMPWRVDPGNDLILNMHLKPTGKVETIQATVGLYFSDKPATAHPMLLQLEHDRAINIPAGDAAFVIEDQLKLPLDVDVLGVYPHAHYLGKRFEGYATLPNGEKKWLVLIRDWDIDRQSVYRFQSPVFLPKNSVLHMRYTYDNSSGNVRNPNSPPIPVKAGNRSVDEMGHLWIQVLPRPLPKAGGDPRMLLERAWMQNNLRKDPDDHVALYNLASMEMASGDYESAATLYRHILTRTPEDVRALIALGAALEKTRDWQQAQEKYEKALAVDPQNVDGLFDLAHLESEHGSYAEAERNYRRLLAVNPKDASAHNEFGKVLLATNRDAEATQEFEAAIAIAPEDLDALYNLAGIEADKGELPRAANLLEQALKLRDDADARQLLGSVYAQSGKLADALDQFKAVQTFRPHEAVPHRQLAQIYAQMGQLRDAINEQNIAISLEPKNADDWNNLGVLHARNGDAVMARKDFDRALTLDPQHVAARANRARL